MTGDQPLAGRLALVTGGTGGIGAAVARRLAARGATVAVSGRDPERGGAVAEALPGGVFVPADLTDGDACVALPARAAEALGGPVTVLVNVAGGGRSQVPLDRTTPERLRHIVALNLESVILVTGAAVPGMVEAGGGSVVSVGGMHATRGMAGAPAYAAAKAGVEAFTRCLAVDFGSAGVVATCVHPGSVATPRFAQWLDLMRSRGEGEAADRAAAAALDPDVVGEWCAFLAGPAGQAMNGRSVELSRA